MPPSEQNRAEGRSGGSRHWGRDLRTSEGRLGLESEKRANGRGKMELGCSMASMPGIMRQMPRLPISVNDELLCSIFPPSNQVSSSEAIKKQFPVVLREEEAPWVYRLRFPPLAIAKCLKWWSDGTQGLRGGPAKLWVSSGGSAELRASGDGPVELMPSGGGPTKFRASSGGTAELKASSDGSVEPRDSSGGLVELLASGYCPAEFRASGGGPTELRASSGGAAVLRASSGGPAEFRRCSRSEEARAISNLSLTLFLGAPFSRGRRSIYRFLGVT
ncbi:hypothetical protein MA16_Dca014547 [Dendrobium catenatum]|uniref:Uncharacterized protein n=1 Tax=Dendrobium catenatum TaxID=906689 RepID=A0A2I0WA27_9ASPA|nr:hypothetical protein MA16_Dca014547 [Dendrobium catenatum]